MNHAQFAHSWNKLKQYIPVRWAKVTEEDMQRIDGNLDTFNIIVEGHYGPMRKEISNWAHRWYCHWSGQYAGYQEASTPASKTEI
jgi:hypothetical protein